MPESQEVPRNTPLGRRFFYTVDHISSSESEESDSMSTTSPVHHSTSKRRNTLRNKVSKLKRSTQSLFRKAPKGDPEVVNGSRLNSDAIADALVKHPDARPAVSADAQGPSGEVTEMTVAECPTISLIIPLPESGSETLLPSTTMSPDASHSDHKSRKPEITRMRTAELAEFGDIELMESVEPEHKLTRDTPQTPTKHAKTPKGVIDTKPPPPGSSETSPYVFDRFTYYQVTAFALAAIGICVVAAPQTYRLFRLR